MYRTYCSKADYLCNYICPLKNSAPFFLWFFLPRFPITIMPPQHGGNLRIAQTNIFYQISGWCQWQMFQYSSSSKQRERENISDTVTLTTKISKVSRDFKFHYLELIILKGGVCVFLYSLSLLSICYAQHFDKEKEN